MGLLRAFHSFFLPAFSCDPKQGRLREAEDVRNPTRHQQEQQEMLPSPLPIKTGYFMVNTWYQEESRQITGERRTITAIWGPHEEVGDGGNCSCNDFSR